MYLLLLFISTRFYDLISKIEETHSNLALIGQINFYFFLWTIGNIKFYFFHRFFSSQVSTTRYGATFVCHSNRQLLKCHDCIRNVIYSRCLSERIINVYSSKKQEKSLEHPTDGAASLEIVFRSSSPFIAPS